MERKIYPSLDVAKFFLALSILLSHTQNEMATDASGIIHNLLAISNFGVPFFFACSGFLFFSKINKLGDIQKNEYYRQYSLRLGKMYLVWTLIYFSFQLTSWLLYGTNMTEVVSYFHRLIVYSSYPTIWFLPALWLGVSIIYLIDNKFGEKYVVFACCFLYLICSLGECYSNIICKNAIIESLWSYYLKIFIVFRNGLFMGAPFVACGYLSSKIPDNKSRNIYVAMALLFSILFIIESVIIKRYHFSDYTHCGILLLPATFCIFQALVRIDIPNKPIYRTLRNLSMLIFLSQRLVLTAIPSVCPDFGKFMIELNPYITIAFVAIIVIVFSIIIEKLSYKYESLKILW